MTSPELSCTSERTEERFRGDERCERMEERLGGEEICERRGEERRGEMRDEGGEQRSGESALV